MGHKLTVYDNDGITFDRYTVVIPRGDVFGMSENPSSPQGFNQYICQEHDLKLYKGFPDGVGQEIHPIPDCIVLGLTGIGFTGSPVVKWVTARAAATSNKRLDFNEIAKQAVKEIMIDGY